MEFHCRYLALPYNSSSQFNLIPSYLATLRFPTPLKCISSATHKCSFSNFMLGPLILPVPIPGSVGLLNLNLVSPANIVAPDFSNQTILSSSSELPCKKHQNIQHGFWLPF